MTNSILEVSVILIMLLVIFSAILTPIENSTEKVTKVQENQNIEKLIAEVVDNLINNPGVPDNWQEYEKGTPGLAIVNEGGQVIANSVAYSKLTVLGKNYDELVTEKMFDSKIKTSLELIPEESSISSVKLGCDGQPDTVFAVTRLVKCDFYKSYVLKDFHNDGKCIRNHDQKENSCNYFKVFPSNLRSSDYYLIIDEDEKYDLKYYVDSTRVVKEKYWETTISDVIYLNNKFDFYDDDSAIVFVHLNKPDARAVIVSVPKDFDAEILNYDYFTTNECKLVMKAWY